MDNIEDFFKDTIDINDNLSEIDKDSIKLVIRQIIGLFNRFDVYVPIENASLLLSNLKVIRNYNQELSDRAYYYDLDQNTIIDNKRFVKDGDRRLYDYCSVVLDIMSKKYNPETSKYSDGLVYEDENSRKFGSRINEKLKHKLVTLMTDQVIKEEKIEDFYVDKANDPCTLEDCLLMDINTIINMEDLLTHFINADGISFYQTICSNLSDDEQKAKDFISNIDEYTRDKSIEQRKKYDEYLALMKQQKLSDGEVKKIA